MHPSGGAASVRPPGGLPVERVPQFVHFGFDDIGISGRDGSGTSGGLRFVNDLFADKRNPAGSGNPRTFDGTPARFSLYVVTRYIETAETDVPEHVKREWRRAVSAGHEIGLHTHNHAHGSEFTSEQWSAEIAACARWLEKPFDDERAADPETGVGVPRSLTFGFRAPFLESGRPLFPALRGNGILYDCSLEEGVDDRFDGTNFLWPYRIAAGYGGERGRLSGALGDSGLRTARPARRGVRAVRRAARPSARLHSVHDYFDPTDGKITGIDWNLWVEFGMSREEVVAIFKYTLDRRLSGNRAPFTFGAHSDIYSEQYDTALTTSAEERRQALRRDPGLRPVPAGTAGGHGQAAPRLAASPGADVTLRSNGMTAG